MPELAIQPAQLVTLLNLAFFSILFLQSGLDKVTDRAGNLEWLKGHFASSPLKNLVPILLATITIFELASGAASGLGVVGVFVPSLAPFRLIGLALSGLSLLMLFAGQRIAKDYPGAASLAIYFGVLLVGIGALASANQR